MAVFAVGEAMQAPRFYEYVADLAPREQMGTFMGFAFLPVALGSFVGGALAGTLVERFVRGSSTPGAMWWVVSGIGFVIDRVDVAVRPVPASEGGVKGRLSQNLHLLVAVAMADSVGGEIVEIKREDFTGLCRLCRRDKGSVGEVHGMIRVLFH